MQAQLKIIKIEGKSKVVEFIMLGQPKRVVLPLDSNNVKLGAPYGLLFSKLLEKTMGLKKAKAVEAELHNTGIWTAQDIAQNVKGARSALYRAFKADVQTLINLAKEE